MNRSPQSHGSTIRGSSVFGLRSSSAGPSCGTSAHFNRRTLLRAAGLSGIAWLTPMSQLLARAAEVDRHRGPAKSVILLWLSGGPSQLETFDPHPGKSIAGGTQAIKTAAAGVQVAEGMGHLAEEMNSISIVRSVISKEGDHERAFYNIKTGFRPDPTILHPSLGAVVCHQLPRGSVEIPRHVSILPNAWPGRGGYLGDAYDAFKAHTTQGRLPDVTARVPDDRFLQRFEDIAIVERAFARGRLSKLEEDRTLHFTTMKRARGMMSSEQLKAFNVDDVPRSLISEYGDTTFGRACLAAIQLTEVGVRCVEITLDGWDSHFNNHEIHRSLIQTLDPAFAALIRDLKRRELLDRTIVLCGGEFGRTPQINPAGGRDHWPHGFSIALAGGLIEGGRVVGATDPEGSQRVEKPVRVEDVHATVLHALGIEFEQELDTPVGRPMKISQGHVIRELLV